MTVQELRESGWIILEAISGSQAYGTALPTSDTDIRGVYIMPTEIMLETNPSSSYGYIPQISDEKNDIVFYEIGRFIQLLEKGNPNILELLNIPNDCIIYKHECFDRYFNNKQSYITKQLKDTFTGYSVSQIKKAKGMNKKVHNPQPKDRKGILDFCYVIDGVKSIPFWTWLSDKYPTSSINYKEEFFQKYISKWGLSKVQNGTGLYGIYQGVLVGKLKASFGYFRGLTQKIDSVDFRLSSIPKEVAESETPTLIYFNSNGFKVHCKEWKQYWEWVEKRNKQRYIDNQKGNVGYDHKNIMHCVRLIEVAEDIVNKNEIIVRRPNRDYLLDIRNGKFTYDEIMDNINKKINNIDNLFDNSDLKDKIDRTETRNLLKNIRLENLKV